jgi:hypothetical protein
MAGGSYRDVALVFFNIQTVAKFIVPYWGNKIMAAAMILEG